MNESLGNQSYVSIHIGGIDVDLFTVNLDSETKDVIVTTAVGRDYFENWKKYSLPSWEKYARKYAIGIIVILSRLVLGAEGEIKNAAWDKLLAPRRISEAFSGVERICLIDTDILISALAPNVFASHTAGSYSVVSQEKNLPFPIKDVRSRIALLRREFYDSSYPLDSILQATAEELFQLQGLPSHSDYFCSGLIVLDHTLFEDLQRCHASVSLSDVKSSVAWEEPYVNHWIQSRSHSWMPYEFQAIWLFEMAWNHPYLYARGDSLSDNREVADVVSSVLLNRHFLHFAGSWHESGAWCNSISKTVFSDEKFASVLSGIQNQSMPVRSLGKVYPPSRA